MPSDTLTCIRCGDAKPPAEFYASGGKPKQPCRGCKKSDMKARDRAKAVPPEEELRGLEPYATADEAEILAAILAAGSMAGAAEVLGIHPRTLHLHLSELKRRAARAGWAPASDMVKQVPDGFHVKGVSTLYGADGEVKGQWVKSQADPEHKLEALAAAFLRFAEPLTGRIDPVPAPPLAMCSADILNVIPLGDPHIGMQAWAAETGQSFDLDIAERNLMTAVDHLVALAPPADECLIINLGDFFHADSSAGTTTRGTRVDVDSRWAKVLGIGLHIMHRCIDRALEKHQRVRVICEIGNHDDNSAIMLAICLQKSYSREPRVTIDTSPAKFHWYRFGKCLIGTTHGDTVKASALPGVMACDRAEDWGQTLHRAFYCGHVHHDSLKEFPGVVVETFRTLAPADAWHKGQGYRSGQDLKLDVWHREFGRVNRHSIGITQLWALQQTG